jgi:hypothetical protein
MPSGISVDHPRMKSATETLHAIAELVDAGGLTIDLASRHAPDGVAGALAEMRDGPPGSPVQVLER